MNYYYESDYLEFTRTPFISWEHSLLLNCSIRTFWMRLLMSKYEIMTLIIEENQFNDGDITLLYNWQQLCDITKMYGTKMQ
jgi:hypothetical protein